MSNEENNTSPSSSPPQPGVAVASFNEAYRAKWAEQLVRSDKSGKVIPSVPNLFKVLDEHPDWKSVIALDEFRGAVMKRKPPPYADGSVGEWGDVDDLRTELWLGNNVCVPKSTKEVQKAVELVANAHKFHEVRDWLESLTWDKKERIDYLFEAYFGAGRSHPDFNELELDAQERLGKYLPLVARMWLVGAIARIYKPGELVRSMVILEGPQDLGKSFAIRALSYPWWTDTRLDLHNVKETGILLRGCWFVEMSELEGLNKAEANTIKQFLSRIDDRYRGVWRARAEAVKRQCIFVGTTNLDEYLRDATGGTRFYPVRCSRADHQELAGDREQLFAEAVQLYKDGVKWWPQSVEEREIFREEQDARYQTDALEISILEWWKASGLKEVTIKDVLVGLGIDKSKWTHAYQIQVGAALRRLGANKGQKMWAATGRRERFYRLPVTVVNQPTVTNK